MKYVLDPMVLALDEHVSEREFKLYVNRLILWGQWVERYPEDCFCCRIRVSCSLWRVSFRCMMCSASWCRSIR